MATTGKSKGLDENKTTFTDTTMNAGKYEGVTNESNPTQASETSGSGKGWSRSDENADTYGDMPSRDNTVSEDSGVDNVSRLSERRSGSNAWSSVQDGAQEILTKAQDLAGDYADRAREAGRNAAEKTTSTIKEYPLQSLLVGFGVGCLVGLLVPRR